MNKSETLKLTIGAKVYCTVHAVRGWYRVTEIRPRDGYIKISGFNTWNPPHNFRSEEHPTTEDRLWEVKGHGKHGPFTRRMLEPSHDAAIERATREGAVTVESCRLIEEKGSAS